MFQGSSRTSLRETFFKVFEKHQKNERLSPLEQQIAAVILEHPEYHELLSQKHLYLESEFNFADGLNNPFLHMSAHLSLREQIATNRPKGIQKIYQNLLNSKNGDPHLVEHLMLPVLLESIYEAQITQSPPDELKYVKKLKKIS